MAEQKLREVLHDLHAQLERSERIDPETRALLREAREDIEEALSGPDPEGPGGRARSRLRRAIEELEAEHPDATALLQRVLHALTNVGL